MTLSSLIERLEKAEGPSRELDLVILNATSEKKWRLSEAWPDNNDVVVEVVDPDWEEEEEEEEVGGVRRYGPEPDIRITPRYTSSIDAALTLVPDRVWQGGRTLKEAHWCQLPGPRASDQFRGSGATEAIAICIAALRARSAMTEEKSNG